MSYDLVLKGGRAFTAAGPLQADLAIQRSTIAAIGQSLEGREHQSIDGK
ncbi:MAG: hypothetical protein ACLFWD_10640 [Anaerolineales bacterium]